MIQVEMTVQVKASKIQAPVLPHEPEGTPYFHHNDHSHVAYEDPAKDNIHPHIPQQAAYYHP